MSRIRIALATVSLAVVALVASASPAAAQQVVDAGKDRQGGTAFILFALMVFIIGGLLFFMDRVRRRRGAGDDE
ncbi:MAG TPA: hypothetical protein VF441_10440 [Acidimicrobiia bacterium]